MMRDRGRIKWAGFYLPDQKKLLSKMYEDEKNVEQPILEENRINEIDDKLIEAAQSKISFVFPISRINGSCSCRDTFKR